MNFNPPLEREELVRLTGHVREEIAAGLESLRAGLAVDGDAFLAAMDAELAELDFGAPA